MQRRLFFLFPDPEHARYAVHQLTDRGNVEQRRVHAMWRRNARLEHLPVATVRQRGDSAAGLEWSLWRANLALFGIALAILLMALFRGDLPWAGGAVVVMGITFYAGLVFATRLPHVHLSEFAGALAHGEVLVMIDVPVQRVAEIEDYVHRHFPDAVTGGTSWTVEAFGL